MASSQPRRPKILVARKETCAMSAKRVSIGQVMMVVALAAVNLAILRTAPSGFVTFPTLWVFVGSIDLVISWKLILKRSLQAFHYTFLIVFIIGFLVMANLVATERLHPLGLLVRWYRHLTGAKTNRISLGFLDISEYGISLGFLDISEFWMACFLSFMLACAVGFVAAWLEGCRDWDIAAFFRGALIGFGIATLLALIDDAAWGWVVVSPVRLIGRWALLGACLILGGLMGRSKLKSSRPG